MIRRLLIFSAHVALSIWALIAVASTNHTPTVWSGDPKVLATFSDPQPFGKYLIRLPKTYSLSTTRKFQTADQWQWHGEVRDDGTRSVIEVWVAELDAAHASGDVTSYGEQLLETAGKDGTSDYVRGKDETGIDKDTGNWVTRFASHCTLTSPSGEAVPLESENYVWLDKGQLLLATVYDSALHSKESEPDAQTAIWSIHS